MGSGTVLQEAVTVPLHGTACPSGGMPPNHTSAPQLACLMHSRRRGSASASSPLARLLQIGSTAAGIVFLSPIHREEDESDTCQVRWLSQLTRDSTKPLHQTKSLPCCWHWLVSSGPCQHQPSTQRDAKKGTGKQPGAPPPGGKPVPVQHESRPAAPRVPPAARAGPLQRAGPPLLLPGGAGPAAAAGDEPHPCRQLAPGCNMLPVLCGGNRHRQPHASAGIVPPAW